MEYKLYGQVKKKCDKNGHMVMRYADEEDDKCFTRDKLERIHTRMIKIADPGLTSTGLVIPISEPDFDNVDNTNDTKEKTHEDMRCPYTEYEFVVKVPRKMLSALPAEDTFITIWVHPTKYKFEKNKYKYNGWNIILKKLSNTVYT